MSLAIARHFGKSDTTIRTAYHYAQQMPADSTPSVPDQGTEEE